MVVWSVGLLVALSSVTASADAASEKRARCATRVALALTGRSPDATIWAAADPQAEVPRLLETTAFIDRFARFLNATFNSERGATLLEDASYFVARRVLATGAPYKDLFLGPYAVALAPTQQDPNNVEVSTDPEGLGYFRSGAWLRRYAGNELAGLKIVTAYRMVNNVLGVQMLATTNAPDADISATGRAAPACRGCHFEGPFALDLVAKVLTRRQGTGAQMTFVPPTDGPQSILGGISIADDRALINAMVDSEAFRFRACRLAFQYLYGRPENRCEGPIFDRCMQAFAQSGTIQSALSTIATDGSFCQ